MSKTGRGRKRYARERALAAATDAFWGNRYQGTEIETLLRLAVESILSVLDSSPGSGSPGGPAGARVSRDGPGDRAD